MSCTLRYLTFGTLDENALANKLGHEWKDRETYDADDGSVVDW